MIDPAASENAFMGALVSDPGRNMPLALDAGVDETWFVCDPWPVVWLAARAIWDRGGIETADAISIWQEARRIAETDDGKKLPGARLADSAAIEAALDVPSFGVEAHIDELRTGRIERRWRATIAEVARHEAAGGIENALAMARLRIDELLGAEIARREVSVPALLDRCIADAKEAYHQRVDPDGPRDLNWTPGYKMPWPELTSMMGGLEPGLHVVAARPSVGKTSFAVNLLRFWTDMGYRVTIDSLDMTEAAVAWRFLAERARVSIKKARFSPTKRDLADLEAARDACAAATTLSLCQIRDVDEFRSYCRIAKSAGRLGIVVVDYLGLMHSRNVNNGNEYERVSYVSDALKSLALDLSVPVVALAQLNREVAKSETKRLPGLSDLRGSGSIEQDAYTVTLLHRDDRVVEGWRERPPMQLLPLTENYGPAQTAAAVASLDAVWAIVCKAQNYGTGTLPFVVRKSYFAWQLGDYAAQPILIQTGHGATAQTITDNSPKFARVHADWRHDPLEVTLECQGALIRGVGYADSGEAIDYATGSALAKGPRTPEPPPPVEPATPSQPTFDYSGGAYEDEEDDGDIDYTEGEPAF